MEFLGGNALSIKKNAKEVLSYLTIQGFESTALEYPPIIYIYIYQAAPKYTGHSIPMFLVGAFPKRFLDLKARV